MSEASPERWKRLGGLLLRRRGQLDPDFRNRTTFAERVRIDYRVLFDIEKARRTNFTPETLAAIEHAYGWAPSSIDQVLAGGDPTPLDRADPARPAENGQQFAVIDGAGEDSLTEEERFYLACERHEADPEHFPEPTEPPGGFDPKHPTEYTLWGMPRSARTRWEMIKKLRELDAEVVRMYRTRSDPRVSDPRREA